MTNTLLALVLTAALSTPLPSGFDGYKTLPKKSSRVPTEIGECVMIEYGGIVRELYPIVNETNDKVLIPPYPIFYIFDENFDGKFEDTEAYMDLWLDGWNGNEIKLNPGKDYNPNSGGWSGDV